MDDEDLKGLEREIEAAIDRLFVEKGGKAEQNEGSIPPFSNVFSHKEREMEYQTVPKIPLPPISSKPLERLEALLLSLEWEITKENIIKIGEEIAKLQKEWQRTHEISAVLQRMGDVITFMIQNEEKIGPHLIRLLTDAKETIKLLLRKEETEDLPIYKKLAQLGIEARFSCLEEFREVKPKRIEEVKKPPLARSEVSEEVLKRIDLLSERVDKLIEKFDHHLSLHEKVSKVTTPPKDGSSSKTSVTIFKTGDRLFGVESENVLSLFKVPASFHYKMNQLKTFRLKGLEVRVVNLGDFFSIPEMDQEGEKQVLILKKDGEYKGVVMDKVLGRLYGPLEQPGEWDEHLVGLIRWTYEGFPIKVPILNFTKL